MVFEATMIGFVRLVFGIMRKHCMLALPSLKVDIINTESNEFGILELQALGEIDLLLGQLGNPLDPYSQVRTTCILLFAHVKTTTQNHGIPRVIPEKIVPSCEHLFSLLLKQTTPRSK